ncbi:MAG: hypothetical protein ACRBK7_27065 [Acidimicrobiales bacterium]
MSQAAANALAKQILADRFEIIAEPLAWRCRGCNTTVSAATNQAGPAPDGEGIARLAEVAADHALFCGRCDD